MKTCQNCGQKYPDDLEFCTEDGERLTAVLRPPDDYPTLVMPSVKTQESPKLSGPSPLIYVLVGGLTVAVILLGIMLFISIGSKDHPVTENAAQGSPGQSDGIIVSTATPATAAPKLPSLTEQSVRALFQRWIASQNSRDFAAYSALYADEFVGYRTTVSGRTTRLDHGAWLRDRAKMFPNFISLAVTGERIRIDGETAVVNFTQTWRSARYCDIGDKELTVQIIDGQAKIRSEVLKNSVPCED